MECSETSFVGDASTKKLSRIRKTGWETSSTSSQDCHDFNSIEPNIGSRGRREEERRGEKERKERKEGNSVVL
jgi:hypothetical protein